MIDDMLTAIEELDSRRTHEIQVSLLWRRDDNRLWVSVLETLTGHVFNVDVEEGERPLEVFNHPFAYAAYHGVTTDVRRLRLAPAAFSA